MILDKAFQEEKCLKLTSDIVKILNEDPTPIREGQLQHFLRKKV